MNYLITYDIKSNKKRKKVSDFLDGYGLRVNLSVYECQLTKKALKEIKTNLRKILNRKTDSIRLYRILQKLQQQKQEHRQRKRTICSHRFELLALKRDLRSFHFFKPYNTDKYAPQIT